MKKRIITASVLIGIVILAFLSRFLMVDLFDVCIGIMSILASLEASNLFNQMGKKHNSKFAIMYPVWFYLIFVISLTFNAKLWVCVVAEVAGLLVFALILYLFMVFTDAKNKLNIIYGSNKWTITLNTFYLFVYPAFMLGSFYFLNNIEYFVANAISKPLFSMMLMLLAILITVLTDTLAFFIGSALKGPKIAPKISPNKGYIGAAAGLVGGVLAGIIIYYLIYWIPALNPALSFYQLTLWHFIILGFAGSLISQIGDFFESYLKRKANVKDSGTLLPGHGGVLDRIDALIFNVPFITIVFLLIL